MVSVLILVLFLWVALLFLDRGEFEKRGIERGLIYLIFRSKKGLVAIDREAKKRERFLRRLGSFAVLISVPLIVLSFVSLFFNARHILRTPEPVPGIAPLLPEGVMDIPGAPSIPLAYWLLSIIVILVFHELMHGLLARVEGIPLKSLGIFAVTFIPLGAFVEPDDEVLEKKSSMSKLRVYAAGSMGNFIAALLSGLLLAAVLFVAAPLAFQDAGIVIYNVTSGSPAERAGISTNLTLLGIGDVDIKNVEDFRNAVILLRPGVPVSLRTGEGDFAVVPDEREGFKNGFIGIAVLPRLEARPFVTGLVGEERAFALYRVISEALYWVAALNLLVGLTNLLPIIPLDGGRMVAVFMEVAVPKAARGVTTFIYLVLLILVFINMGPLFGLF